MSGGTNASVTSAFMDTTVTLIGVQYTDDYAFWLALVGWSMIASMFAYMSLGAIGADVRTVSRKGAFWANVRAAGYAYINPLFVIAAVVVFEQVNLWFVVVTGGVFVLAFVHVELNSRNRHLRALAAGAAGVAPDHSRDTALLWIGILLGPVATTACIVFESARGACCCCCQRRYARLIRDEPLERALAHASGAH